MTLVQTFRVGRLTCHALDGGRQRLDGGAMFGVVPKPLWERRVVPDERNRIPLALRCLLIEHDDGLVLVDTGVGNKENSKFIDIYAVENMGKTGRSRLDDAIVEAGFSSSDIKYVINTHLHFDHAGGNTFVESPDPSRTGLAGDALVTFPHAVFVVQKRELPFAKAPNERTQASYLSPNFDPITNAGAWRLVDGEADVLPGIRLLPTPGHVPYHQTVLVESAGETACFVGDLIGLMLVTGTTGSGKSTTLAAMIDYINTNRTCHIITIEDPIEFLIRDKRSVVNQREIGVDTNTFASALRTALRQDPDVILVGETRDRETVEIACQAAMTEHMVLSTLHTNSAVGAVTRMLGLGADSAVLATSLTLVIAQRLVRRICNECREEYEPGETTRQRAGLFGDRIPVYRGRGCPACGGTGFAGRIGIYEFFKPTNAIKKLINDRASEADMRIAARQSGMVPLREDAVAKIKAGITSPDEVLRVVQVDENEVPCPACKALIVGPV